MTFTPTRPRALRCDGYVIEIEDKIAVLYGRRQKAVRPGHKYLVGFHKRLGPDDARLDLPRWAMGKAFRATRLEGFRPIERLSMS